MARKKTATILGSIFGGRIAPAKEVGAFAALKGLLPSGHKLDKRHEAGAKRSQAKIAAAQKRSENLAFMRKVKRGR